MTESTQDTIVGTAASGAARATSDGPGDDADGSARGPSEAGLVQPGALVGRYVVLSKLGAGAMGVVLAAYDPELDRKVALKLLKPRHGDAEDARSRLQREAQALAKLNHTNVVAVHDVGVHEEQVFVAMEFVEGRTLDSWVKAEQPTWREVVRVFEAAGRGLAAAHAQGLIHRDFKPENVMIGDDGRVRVMDFGLARASQDDTAPAPREEFVVTERDALSTPLTQTGALMGTPAYMSPEQYTGSEVTARSDQFAFCVALHEALYRVRPFPGRSTGELAFSVVEGKVVDPPRGARVPAWLRRIVLRGLSVKQAARFPDMDGLLRSLRTGESKRQGRRIAAGLGVAATGVAAVVGLQRIDVAQRAASCDMAAAAVEEIWNDDARDAVRAGILATGASYAPGVAQRIPTWVERQASAWHQAQKTACMNATVEESWEAPTYEKAQWCLEERRLQLATLVDGLAGADVRGVQTAILAAADLAPIAPCVDAAALATIPVPPPSASKTDLAAVREGLARADYHRATGSFEEGLALVREIETQAESLEWPPLLAAVQLVEGRLLESAGEYDQAYEAAKAAYLGAAKSSAWDLAASAAGDVGFVLGSRLSNHAAGEDWFEHARVAISHSGDASGLREARRGARLADLLFTASRYDESMALYEQSYAVLEPTLGAEHPRVANIVKSMAEVHQEKGNYDEALAGLERASALAEAALGPEHPVVAWHLHSLANLHRKLGRHDEAKRIYARAIAIREQALGLDHPVLAASLNNLGIVHYGAGEIEQARALYLRTLEIFEAKMGPDSVEVAEAYNNLGILDYTEDNYEAAEKRWLAALAIREKALGPDHLQVATVLGNLSEIYGLTGRLEKAMQMSRRALEIEEHTLGEDHPKLGLSLTSLGTAMSLLDRHEEALAHLERALDIRGRLDPDPTSIADTKIELAAALWRAPTGQGRDRARARTLMTEARDAYAADGADASVAQANEWLEAHPLGRG